MDPVGTDDHHQGQTQIQSQTGHGIGNGGNETGFHIHAGEFVVDAAEPALLKFSFAQGLDDTDAGDVLLNGPDHPVQNALLLGVEGDAGLGDEIDHDADDRQQTDEHQRKDPVHGQHHANAANQQNGGPDAQALESGQQLVYIISIAGEPGFGGGDGQLVHLPGRKALELLEQIVADGTGDAAGAFCAHPVCPDVAAQTAGGAEQHQSAVEPDGQDVPGGNLLIQHHFHETGDQQFQHRAQQFDHHGETDEAQVGEDVFLQSDQGGGLLLSCICNNFNGMHGKSKA